MKTHILKGKGVTLEPLSVKHISVRYGSWFGDSEVCRDNRHGKKALTTAQLRDYLRSISEDDTIRVFAILEGPKKNHVGNISLNGISRKNGFGEISILLGEKSAWGKGIGYEACRLVQEYAHKKIKLHRVWMGMTARNAAMIRIAEKLGMKREGVKRGAFFKNGRHLDLVEYASVKDASAGGVVLLTKYGNIMGMEYLRAFRKEGIALEVVVFEGDNVDEKDRQIVMERTAGHYKPLFMGDVLNDAPFAVHYVQKHNSGECEELLRRLAPTVIVLGGAGILPEKVLKLASRATLNCHPGKLPEYRGCSCVEWSVLNEDAVAATCHTVTAKIDWGANIYSEPMAVQPGTVYPKLRSDVIAHQAKVMTIGLKRFLEKKGPWPLMQGEGRYWKTMGAEDIERVKEKLSKGEYHPSEKALCR